VLYARAPRVTVSAARELFWLVTRAGIVGFDSELEPRADAAIVSALGSLHSIMDEY
jgi:hypothetical protein